MKVETSKYTSLIESESNKDEQGNGQGNNNADQASNAENSTKFTLGDLLSMFGTDTDSPYVSIVQKMHELLGQAGKKGLDDEGKAAIDLLIKDLNKFAPKIGPLIERVVQQKGYDLGVEIPIEYALIGYTGFVGFRITATRNNFIKAQKKKEAPDNNAETLGGAAWQ